MITWIQTVLQKHHKSVFSVLLVAIIIAFVFTIGQVPFLGDRNRSWDSHKNFFGYDFSNPNSVQQLQTCAFYEALLQGVQPTSEVILTQAYLFYTAEKLGMRSVSENDLKNYIHSAPFFKNSAGQFDELKWKDFVSQNLASGRMSEADLIGILSRNALAHKVAELIGGPGYVLKSEVKRQYNQYYGTWNFDLASLSYEKFNPRIETSEAKLQKYFKDNIEAYRVGDGVIIEAVIFPVKDYAAQVKAPTDADLSAYYGANAKKYTELKDGKTVIKPLAEVKQKVKADYLVDASTRKAAQAAEDFAMKIYNSGAKMASAELKKLIAESKLETKKMPAMRLTDVKLPEGLPMEVAASAFKLDSNNFFSDAIISNENVWIVILNEKLSSYLPKFGDVKKRVEEDYVNAEKQKLFSERGKTLSEALKVAVKDGKSFIETAKQSGASVDDFRTFSIANPPVSNSSIMRAYNVITSILLSLKEGQVSSMQTYGENGYIVYLKKFTPPAENSTNAKELSDIEKAQENQSAAMLAYTVMSDEINKEAKSANIQEQ